MTEDVFAIVRTTTDTGKGLYSEGPMQTHTANYYYWKGHGHGSGGRVRQDVLVPDAYQYAYNSGYDTGRKNPRKVDDYDM